MNVFLRNQPTCTTPCATLNKDQHALKSTIYNTSMSLPTLNHQIISFSLQNLAEHPNSLYEHHHYSHVQQQWAPFFPDPSPPPPSGKSVTFTIFHGSSDNQREETRDRVPMNNKTHDHLPSSPKTPPGWCEGHECVYPVHTYSAALPIAHHRDASMYLPPRPKMKPLQRAHSASGDYHGYDVYDGTRTPRRR
ncbi:unnamed protein product [Ectocarpus sp. 6 AP-2014]